MADDEDAARRQVVPTVQGGDMTRDQWLKVSIGIAVGMAAAALLPLVRMAYRAFVATNFSVGVTARHLYSERGPWAWDIWEFLAWLPVYYPYEFIDALLYPDDTEVAEYGEAECGGRVYRQGFVGWPIVAWYVDGSAARERLRRIITEDEDAIADSRGDRAG